MMDHDSDAARFHYGDVLMVRSSARTAVVFYAGQIAGHYCHHQKQVLLNWATPDMLDAVANAIRYLCYGAGPLFRE